MTIKNNIVDLLRVLIGSLLFAISINVFLIPVHVYSAGFMGIAQLIRDAILHTTHLQFPFDIAGSINFILNVFVFVFACRYISKRFAAMTLLTIGTQSIFLSLIPIPPTSILAEPIVSVIVGSCLCALGTVSVFNGRGSGGGIDVIGIYLSQHNKGSVGKIYLIVNMSIYAICLVFYNFETAIYSILSSYILSFAVDQLHNRNIEVEIMIFSRNTKQIKDEILQIEKRGLTCWKGVGAYTDSPNEVLVTVVTKSQSTSLIHKIKLADPNAFVIVNENIKIYGNFYKEIV